MFLSRSMVSSALLVLGSFCCLLGADNRRFVAAQFGAEMCTPESYEPTALAMWHTKLITKHCVDVPYDGGVHEQCFFMYVPNNCKDNDASVPLVVDVHGVRSCPLLHTMYSGWLEKADQNCFVVIWPIGHVPSVDFPVKESCFNVPGFLQSDDFGVEGGNSVTTSPCCCFLDEGRRNPISVPVPNDPLFLKMAIDSVLESVQDMVEESGASVALSIDADRVYMAGHSNGCIASMTMAALYSDTIAAVCCHAGAVLTPFSLDYTPVPVWTIHGMMDPVIPYNGGSEVLPGVGSFGFWSIPQTTAYLATKNNCLASGSEGVYSDNVQIGTVYKGTNCDQNASVEVVTLNTADHFPYLANPVFNTIDTTELAWAFCSAQSRPTFSCENNPNEFELKPNSGKMFSCEWLSQLRPKWRQKRCMKPKFADECPGLCNKTYDKCLCEDSPFPFKWAWNLEEMTTCSDVVALGPQKIRKKCRHSMVRSLCPSICDGECKK
jgi:poly(3-hydroxybutyrate) depolymerase